MIGSRLYDSYYAISRFVGNNHCIQINVIFASAFLAKSPADRSIFDKKNSIL